MLIGWAVSVGAGTVPPGTRPAAPSVVIHVLAEPAPTGDGGLHDRL